MVEPTIADDDEPVLSLPAAIDYARNTRPS
jgi:hypothetical protein